MKEVIIYVSVVVVTLVLMGVFVLSPSYRERDERCAALGGEIISSGDCVKKGSLL